MAKTKIQWSQEVWNPIVGCSVVSPGCTNCYAMRMAWRLANNPATPHYHGTVKMVNGNPVWAGKVAMAPETTLTAPLRRRIPTTWFVNSMGDLFHEDVPDEWIDRVFAVMALCPQHRFQVLTKRAARMREHLTRDGVDYAGNPMGEPGMGARDAIRREMVNLGLYEGLGHWPLPNVHLGVSAEDQRRAEERIPDLLETPAAVRFVSYEPALGPVNLSHWDLPGGYEEIFPLGLPEGRAADCAPYPKLDWVIVGGESGPGARPCNVAWIRQAVAQCHAAGVPVFVKQLGKYPVQSMAYGDVPVPLRNQKGGDPSEWPADLRIREMPR